MWTWNEGAKKRDRWLGLVVLAALLAACGGGRPTSGSGGGEDDSGTSRGDGGDGGGGSIDEDGGMSPPRGNFAAVSGTVWAPGNAPGMVPDGQEIPVFGAVVYLLAERPEPIPDRVYCQPCQEPPEGAIYATSNHQGRFVVSGVVPGDYWLVIEKGQFRLERQISLAPREVADLPAELTTLPSVHNPAVGNWVPRIAIATGYFDSLEDVIGKMGIGGVDGENRFTEGPGFDRIDFYLNGGRSTDLPRVRGNLAQLVADRDRLMQYHIVFIPCSGSTNTDALQNPDVLRNLQAYVAEGGKLYVTDWSGEWNDNVFPAFVKLEGSSKDTPPEAFDAGDLSTRDDDSWDPSLFGDADGSAYDAEDAEAADDDLRRWLDGQLTPVARSSAVQPVDAANFLAVANFNTILETPDVPIGIGDEGTIYGRAKAWVVGTSEYGPGGKTPLTVTYEPTGCGRVLFTTYHTTPNAHAGLVPQERVLVYLVMEIGVCKSGPILM